MQIIWSNPFLCCSGSFWPSAISSFLSILSAASAHDKPFSALMGFTFISWILSGHLLTPHADFPRSAATLSLCLFDPHSMMTIPANISHLQTYQPHVDPWKSRLFLSLQSTSPDKPLLSSLTDWYQPVQQRERFLLVFFYYGMHYIVPTSMYSSTHCIRCLLVVCSRWLECSQWFSGGAAEEANECCIWQSVLCLIQRLPVILQTATLPCDALQKDLSYKLCHTQNAHFHHFNIVSWETLRSCSISNLELKKMWIVELDRFRLTVFHFSSTLICHVNKGRVCHKKEAQVELVRRSDQGKWWFYDLMAITGPWEPGGAWHMLRVQFLCIHRSIIMTSQKFYRFPHFSLSLLLHPSTQTNSPLHDMLWKTCRAPIGWSLLPCVLWLAEVLVHAWGTQAGHVSILWRKLLLLQWVGFRQEGLSGLWCWG